MEGVSACAYFHDPNANSLHRADGVPAQLLAHMAAAISLGHREQVDQPVIGLPGGVPRNEAGDGPLHFGDGDPAASFGIV
jgi:hypothetical protein